MKNQAEPVMSVQAGSTDLLTTTFALATPVPAGAILRVMASGATMMQNCRVDAVAVDRAGSPQPMIQQFSRAAMELEWNWHIATLSLAMIEAPRDLQPGECIAIQFHLAHGSRRATGPIQAAVAESGLTWTMTLGMVAERNDLTMHPVADPCVIVFTPAPAVSLEATLRPDGSLAVGYFDAFGNPAVADAAALTITGAQATVAIPLAGDSTKATVAPFSALPAYEGRVTVQDACGREVRSSALPRALDGTPIFFGEFHWHTNHSGDGQRPLADALTSARDELALDFAGPADHMGPNGGYQNVAGLTTVATQAEICRAYDEPGRFCTIPTAELSARAGHANLLTEDFDLLQEIAARIPAEFAPHWIPTFEGVIGYPWQALLALCPPGRSLVIPHHTNMDSYVREHVVRPDDGLPYWTAMDWPLPADRQVTRLVEIVQSRGSFEAETPEPVWRGDAGGFGGSVQTALCRGYRLGFVGGTDNHNGWPTRFGTGRAGMTAVQGSTLDTASIFHALHQRRCYATSGARIVADATLNGQPLGSELRLAPGAPREFRIAISGTTPLVQAQVISAGAVLAELPVDGESLDLATTWVDDRPGRPVHDVYYYIRARQADGHCVWLSPFWVDLDTTKA